MGKKLQSSMKKFAGIKLNQEEAEQHKQQMSVMLQFLDRLSGNLNTLHSSLSTVDKAISQIMHDIEEENFNASEGYAVLKMLQDMRRERRRIKSEIDALTTIKDQVKGSISQLQTSLRKALTTMHDYEHYIGLRNDKVDVAMSK